MKQKPPKTLSAARRRWWSELQQSYGIEDAGGLSMLNQAAEALDRAEEARALLKKDGLVIADRFGQKVPHPASRVLAAAEASYRGSMRLLNLSPEPKRKD